MFTARTESSERLPFREMLADVVPLIGFVRYGPPVVFVLGPWLLLVLLLAGPLAWFFALVVVVIAAATAAAAQAAAIRPRGVAA